MSASNIFLIVSIRFSLQRIEICIDIFKNGVFAYLKHEKKKKTSKKCKNFSQNILLLLLYDHFCKNYIATRNIYQDIFL